MILPFSNKSLFAILTCAITIFCRARSTTPSTEPHSQTVTRFLLIRHGRTDWNTQDRMQGHSDIPLNEKGKQQAQNVAKLLMDNGEKVDAIYSSDLERAYFTADAISANYNHEIIIDQELREAYLGDAEGMLESDFHKIYTPIEQDLDALYPNRWDRWQHNAIRNAETKAQVLNRIETFLNKIAPSHKQQTVIIVTHGAVIKTLIAHYTEKILPTPNCCIAEFHYNHDKNMLSFHGIKHIE